ncbi:hypothetical protein GQ600_16091 [Phytophthora cactorum]|nr:hypothetical protein GQ600_16091 [Phytophthora cactorum]
MLAYLGIEKDDENDEDFVVNEDGEGGGDSKYEPRRRKSWLLDELKPMESEEDTIVNVVALFRPSAAIRTWDDFNKHFDIYKKKHNLKFRVRSSKRTVLYNT